MTQEIKQKADATACRAIAAKIQECFVELDIAKNSSTANSHDDYSPIRKVIVDSMTNIQNCLGQALTILDPAPAGPIMIAVSEDQVVISKEELAALQEAAKAK